MPGRKHEQEQQQSIDTNSRSSSRALTQTAGARA
jgi:hypothetical protein